MAPFLFAMADAITESDLQDLVKRLVIKGCQQPAPELLIARILVSDFDYFYSPALS